MTGYDTNLAAEFHVMATLYRLGVSAHLTLGNKKGVDIVIARDRGDAITVEVKGVAKSYDWPANNLTAKTPNRHFIVLVCYEGAISKPTVCPKCWVIPYLKIGPFMRQYAGRRNISRSAVIRSGQAYLDTWDILTG